MISSENDFDVRWNDIVEVTCDVCPAIVEIPHSDYMIALHTNEQVCCSDCGGEQPQKFDDDVYDGSFWNYETQGNDVDNSQRKA